MLGNMQILQSRLITCYILIYLFFLLKICFKQAKKKHIYIHLINILKTKNQVGKANRAERPCVCVGIIGDLVLVCIRLVLLMEGVEHMCTASRLQGKCSTD